MSQEMEHNSTGGINAREERSSESALPRHIKWCSWLFALPPSLFPHLWQNSNRQISNKGGSTYPNTILSSLRAELQKQFQLIWKYPISTIYRNPCLEAHYLKEFSQNRCFMLQFCHPPSYALLISSPSDAAMQFSQSLPQWWRVGGRKSHEKPGPNFQHTLTKSLQTFPIPTQGSIHKALRGDGFWSISRSSKGGI